MKSFATLLLCFVSLITHAQYNGVNFDLNKFTSFDSNELRFDQIVPDADYVYWKCVSAVSMGMRDRKPLINERIVIEKGNQKYARHARQKQSSHGFLVSNGPVFDYYYIVAVRKNKSVELIDTDVSFCRFIGSIDNIEEVKLMARRNRLFVNLKRKDTGSYRKSGGDYFLYLHDHLQSCLPGGDGKDEQSVAAMLTAEGEFNVLKRNYYNK